MVRSTITWTCSRTVVPFLNCILTLPRLYLGRGLAFALSFFALAGCDDLGPFGSTAEPLTRATLASGAVSLVAPRGYCIDRRSLQRNFALLARCDTLGVEGFFVDAELAVISVSTVAFPEDPGNGDVDLALDANGEVLETVRLSELTMVRLRIARAPFEGVSREVWRAGYVEDGLLVSLALYAPEDSAARGREGARILSALAQASRAADAGS